MKTCSRTQPLFCTGEVFLPLDTMNTGYSLKTLCLRYEEYFPLFKGVCFLYLCFFIPVLLLSVAHQRALAAISKCVLSYLYRNFCHSVCVCVLFWGFFWSMDIQVPSDLEAILAVYRFLPDNWFSCLKDSHIVNEGTDLPDPCMVFLFPAGLPCCLMKLVYFRILAANTSNLLECIWKRKKLNFCDRINTKCDN